jgi:hypothetical protein
VADDDGTTHVIPTGITGFNHHNTTTATTHYALLAFVTHDDDSKNNNNNFSDKTNVLQNGKFDCHNCFGMDYFS